MLQLKRFAVAFYGGSTHPQLVALVAQVGCYVQDVSAGNNLQKHLVQASIVAKSYGTEASLQKDVSSTDEKDFKGHDMLAPFTAGWQSTDVNPLVIAKSEGSYVYDINGKKYLDSLAGLWCTALG